MKYTLSLIVLLSLLIFSCKKSQEEEIIVLTQLEKDKKDICSSIGTKPQMPTLIIQNQLLKIERIREIEDKELVNIDSFIYDANNELIYIKERIINIINERINTDVFEFKFKEGLLTEINQVGRYLPVGRDSLVYDINGNLLSIFSFKLQLEPYISLSNPYTLFSVDSFFYDNKGYLNYRNCYWINLKQHFSHNIYCWENGNLTNIKNYNTDGELTSENISTYIDEKEFKITHLDPRLWQNAQIWSTNKAIDSQFFDYVGNIDFVCNPCDIKYEYDELGRITKIDNGYSTTKYTYRN